MFVLTNINVTSGTLQTIKSKDFLTLVDPHRTTGLLGEVSLDVGEMAALGKGHRVQWNSSRLMKSKSIIININT
jgi:hypothetical protein